MFSKIISIEFFLKNVPFNGLKNERTKNKGEDGKVGKRKQSQS